MRAVLLRFCQKTSKKADRVVEKSEKGFSVLEAMIAMALLAAAFLPLLALQGQFVKSTESLERAEHRIAVRDMALARIQNVNLMIKPEGKMETAYGTLQWTAQAVRPPRRVKGRGGVDGRYEITLFEVTVNLINYDETTPNLIDSFSFKSLGWRPSRSLIDTL